MLKILSNKQNQQSGDYSTNIQAQNITINGVTVSEARQIALDVFESNFYRLKGEALIVVQERAEKMIDLYLDRLLKINPNAINTSKDPGMQYAIYTAQKEYARTGDDNVAELLVDILVDRTTQNERTLKQIVLDESLLIVPKLTLEQFDILSIVYLLKYTRNHAVTNPDMLFAYIVKYISPFIPCLTKERSCYQHLEYTGCASVSISSNKIENLLRETYKGLFCKGFTKDKFDSILDSSQVRSKLLIPCFHNNELWQFIATHDDKLEKFALDAGVTPEDVKRLKTLFNSNLMSEIEVKLYLTDLHPGMGKLFDFWDNSLMKHMSLTSVGIAIAIANIRKKIGDKIGLGIWIK